MCFFIFKLPRIPLCTRRSAEDRKRCDDDAGLFRQAGLSTCRSRPCKGHDGRRLSIWGGPGLLNGADLTREVYLACTRKAWRGASFVTRRRKPQLHHSGHSTVPTCPSRANTSARCHLKGRCDIFSGGGSGQPDVRGRLMCWVALPFPSADHVRRPDPTGSQPSLAGQKKGDPEPSERRLRFSVRRRQS